MTESRVMTRAARQKPTACPQTPLPQTASSLAAFWQSASALIRCLSSPKTSRRLYQVGWLMDSVASVIAVLIHLYIYVVCIIMCFTSKFYCISTTEVFPDAPGETPLTPQDEDYLVIDFSPGADTGSGQGQGRRVVSEVEWNLLHEEIRRARSRMGRSCQLCTSYQSQLQKVGSLVAYGGAFCAPFLENTGIPY